MRLFVVSLGCASLAGACSDDDAPPDDTSYNCAAESRDDEFVVGLEKLGQAGKLRFKLLSATPAPPARGDNTWVLQLTAVGGGTPGAPVTGATMTVTPFMPDHQHGSPKTTAIQPMAEAGHYQLAPVNMWMPGLWETTINVSGADGDRVAFAFCLPS
jgi:hypothetical protein